MPRLTTLAKLFAADHWIVLDDVQCARRDYQHRARIAALDGRGPDRWLTLPTHRPSGRATLIRDALIADPGRGPTPGFNDPAPAVRDQPPLART
ncbi:WbqC family protein [Streptomyces sp. SID8352]|uniref:WbqC family protein n=1 Tax=Streptomyces sp. SID8352 TaxID=2690338 RepID=UPI0031F5F589